MAGGRCGAGLVGTGAALAVAAEGGAGDIDEGEARAALCWVTSVCVTVG